jgi:membrane protease YdiL (CAAX protease family)
VGWTWWAVTLFLNGAIILGALGLFRLLGNEVPPFPSLGAGLLLDIVITFVVVALLNGEEIGWRGFALPRLQERFGVLAAVGTLGVVETIFHLPIFFNNGSSQAGGQNGTPFGAFLLTSVFAVFLFVWLYNHTRGSLLIATAFHASMNAWSKILPFPATSPSFFWLLAAAQLVVIATVLVIGGTAWMSSSTSNAQQSLERRFSTIHRTNPSEPVSAVAVINKHRRSTSYVGQRLLWPNNSATTTSRHAHALAPGPVGAFRNYPEVEPHDLVDARTLVCDPVLTAEWRP